MATEHRFEIIPDEGEATPRRRSKWASCLIGCLVVLGVMLVLMIVVAVWVARSWRGWAADFGSQAVSHAIDTSDLPPQEKGEVKVQVERVAKSLRDGQISGEQAKTILQGVFESPLMPALVVAAVDKHYLERSGLTDDEKAQGRIALSRFARGMIDHKIDEKGLDSVMVHVADRQPNGEWRLRQQVSDTDLRAALTEAKARADETGIAAEPEEFDPSDEFKRIIDEALNEG